MKVSADTKTVWLSRTNLEILLDNLKEGEESWCSKGGWTIIAEPDELHYADRLPGMSADRYSA